MAKRHDISGDDALRLLCNAVRKVHHFERHDEGISPPCRDAGELMLQAALYYLAYGDVAGAKSLIEDYEGWLATGVAPWPYDGGPPPGQGAASDLDDGIPF